MSTKQLRYINMLVIVAGMVVHFLWVIGKEGLLSFIQSTGAAMPVFGPLFWIGLIAAPYGILALGCLHRSSSALFIVLSAGITFLALGVLGYAGYPDDKYWDVVLIFYLSAGAILVHIGACIASILDKRAER